MRRGKKKLARTRRRRNKGKWERMREAEQRDALFLSMDGYTYASLCLWAFRIKLPSSNTQQGGPSRTVHPSEREASRLQTFQMFQNINSFKPFAPVPFGAVMSRAAVWELKGEGDHTALQLQLLESGWSDHGPGHYSWGRYYKKCSTRDIWDSRGSRKSNREKVAELTVEYIRPNRISWYCTLRRKGSVRCFILYIEPFRGSLRWIILWI